MSILWVTGMDLSNLHKVSIKIRNSSEKPGYFPGGGGVEFQGAWASLLFSFASIEALLWGSLIESTGPHRTVEDYILRGDIRGAGQSRWAHSGTVSVKSGLSFLLVSFSGVFQVGWLFYNSHSSFLQY